MSNESKRVGKLVGAKHKQCYINAMRVIWYVPEYEDADYVEGYAVIDGGFCIEHGWVEHDGVVIDPTLPDDDIAYFPGLRFSGGLGISEALQIPKPGWCEDLPILYRFGWGGIESPEFRSAMVATQATTTIRIAAGRIKSAADRFGSFPARATTASGTPEKQTNPPRCTDTPGDAKQ